MKQLSQKAHAAAFYTEFFSNTQHNRYVMGINQFADAVDNITNLNGFIDEYTTATEYRGKPVIQLNEVPPGSMVISTVTEARPNTAMKKLQRLIGVVSMDYFAVADASHFQLPPVKALLDTQREYSSHTEKFEWIKNLLADEESREIFNRVMEFRLNSNLRAMRFFDYVTDQAWLEPFLKFLPGEVFVDGGSLNGSNSQEFIKHCPQFGGIHLFAASQNTLETAKEQLKSHSNIHFHPIGLFNEKKTLSYNIGIDSKNCETAATSNLKIEVDSLDNQINQTVNFIRLDLAGSELKALAGMTRHIQQDHPKIMVAVHHNPSHFWQVPEIILGIRNDYKVYFRHYSEGWINTMMFFIPK
jgi:FkbM family methyltransferase